MRCYLISRVFKETSAIDTSQLTRPLLQVVIDTEEEFDWNKFPDRSATQVSAMRHIDRVQNIFDQYGIRPCYVVDYAIASQPDGFLPLKHILDSGRCEIGAHLQPWVNPPFVEELSVFNMYPGNLERATEKEKLRMLSNVIGENFGQRPEIYKAGRYGLGPNSASVLEDLGFLIDLSVCPPFDNREDGGPNYIDFDAAPFWFHGSRDYKLLELPVTGGFVGSAGSASRDWYKFAKRFGRFKLPGLFSKLSFVDRLMLSPEGFSSEEHKKLTISLLEKGVRTFTWSFHSPSVEPGHTPYVETKKDLENFLDSFKVFFDFFFGELEGEASSPLDQLERYRNFNPQR